MEIERQEMGGRKTKSTMEVVHHGLVSTPAQDFIFFPCSPQEQNEQATKLVAIHPTPVRKSKWEIITMISLPSTTLPSSLSTAFCASSSYLYLTNANPRESPVLEEDLRAAGDLNGHELLVEISIG